MNWIMFHGCSRTLPLLGVGLLVLALPVTAQRITANLSAERWSYDLEVIFSGTQAGPAAFVQSRVPRTHWLEGGLVGGGALSILGGVIGHALCTNSDVRQNCTRPTIRLAALGAGVGFVMGALIGGQFPKRD